MATKTTKTKLYNGKIPFGGKDGKFMSYPMEQYSWDGTNRTVHPIDWRDNEVFSASLRITGTSRGQSAARFVLEDVDSDQQYEMFMTDAVKMIQSASIEKGVITGQWAFSKRGANFGVRHVEA